MKRFVSAFLALTIVFSLLSGVVSADTTVYITKTGSKYHNWGCKYLSASCISISLSSAKSRGYTPCDVCHAPSSAHTHSWDNGKVTTAATCAKTGVRTYSCTGCGQTRTESIPATNVHTWNSGIVTTAATCVKAGVRTYACTVCGKTKTESIPATGVHTWNSGVETKAATCTETGIRTYSCTGCGTTKTQATPINPDAHAWICTEVILAPDGDQHGYGVFQCNRCKKNTENEICPSSEYSDVKNDWSHKGIDYVIDKGIMNGTSNSTKLFSPKKPTNRAMIVQILYRLAGEPEVTGEMKFQDVAEGKWYYNAVLWATQNGIANGKNAASFDPNGYVTREQISAFLYRYSRLSASFDPDVLDSFPDASSVSSYAKQSMCWAVDAGILTGKGHNGVSYLDSKANANRDEVATMVYRFINLKSAA